MEPPTLTPELLRLSSIQLSPLEYFTNSSNTTNSQFDLILLVGQERFHCHRLLLTLVSPVFARMFDGEFKEHNAREITLEGKSSEGILDLLKYIYPQFNGQINNDNIENFLQLADEYMIEHLKQPCKDFLLRQLQLFKFVVLPTQEKLEQPSVKSKNFHASDSALNVPPHSDENPSEQRTSDRSRIVPRPTSSSRQAHTKPTSGYLKPTDKTGSAANKHPRYILFLDKTKMPVYYETHKKLTSFTNNELETWLRRLRILYQIDKGRNYGEIIDYILSILQFIPTNLLVPLVRMTVDTYSTDEIMLNDIARARMHMLEEWASDGDPHRSVNLTESYRTMSPNALMTAQQTTVTTAKVTDNPENAFQSVINVAADPEESTSSVDSDTD